VAILRNQNQLVKPKPAAAPKPAITQNPASAAGTSSAASNFVRVSPGLYRDTSSGQLVKGNPSASAAPAKTTSTAATNPASAAPKNLDSSAIRVGSGQWKLADGRVVSSAGRPSVGQFGQTTPTQTATTTTASTEQVPTTVDNTQPQSQSTQLPQDVKNFLFPTTNMAEDPIYQNTLKKGQAALDAKLASMGLSGSGREVTMTQDLISELDMNTQKRYLDQNQENAGRLATMMENSATRNQNANRDEWNQVLEATRLMMDQNPAKYGWEALNQSNQISSDINSANLKNNADAYNRVRSAGGGSAPVRSPVDTSGYDAALLNMIKATNSSRNATDTSGLVSGGLSALSSLFGFKG
jgi:hypothetical protein